MGLWASGLENDVFATSASQLPFILDREFLVQALRQDFSHEMLLGMDVIGLCEFTTRGDGTATLILP